MSLRNRGISSLIEIFWKRNTKLLFWPERIYKQKVNLRKVPLNDINSSSFPILTSRLYCPIHFLHRSTLSSRPTLKMVYFIYEKNKKKIDISWYVRGDGCVVGLRRAWLPRFANHWRSYEKKYFMEWIQFQNNLVCCLFDGLDEKL